MTHVTLAGVSRRMRNRTWLAAAPGVIIQLSKINLRRNSRRGHGTRCPFLPNVKCQELTRSGCKFGGCHFLPTFSTPKAPIVLRGIWQLHGPESSSPCVAAITASNATLR